MVIFLFIFKLIFVNPLDGRFFYSENMSETILINFLTVIEYTAKLRFQNWSFEPNFPKQAIWEGKKRIILKNNCL